MKGFICGLVMCCVLAISNVSLADCCGCCKGDTGTTCKCSCGKDCQCQCDCGKKNCCCKHKAKAAKKCHIVKRHHKHRHHRHGKRLFRV